MRIFNLILKKWILSLVEELDSSTFSKYKRINPFYENFVPWDRKSNFFSSNQKGITVYNSATIVGDVSIGSHTWIGPFTTLDGTGGLRIGKHVSISSGAQLLSHDSVDFAISGGALPYSYSSTEIGDFCFIGTNAVILRGRSVGRYCVVGAGSIVTQNLPDYSIAAGNPAKIIGRIELNLDGGVSHHYL
jgi:acetyltransferase-like isoleucine patch superfamily enzyme